MWGYPGHVDEPEPQDRIDFGYSAGLTVLDSRVIAPGDNEWPSDHAGVLTTFQVD